MTDDANDTIDAGPFGEWLTQIQGAIHSEHDSDVPCGTCTGCCRSSQFIHIGPDETDTLAHIPKQLLFPAPRAPHGHVLMGYDAQGCCPMLIDDRCSIYEHRPSTCRAYDCRVFEASGLDLLDDPDKISIADRATRWRFQHVRPSDDAKHQAVRAAAEFVRAHCDELPPELAPLNTTQLAVAAIQTHAAFLVGVSAAIQELGPQPSIHAVTVALRGRPSD